MHFLKHIPGHLEICRGRDKEKIRFIAGTINVSPFKFVLFEGV